MGFGEPKMPTREEVAKMQKERTLNDADLIKNGADYEVDDNGNSVLMPTGEQYDSAKNEMGESFYKENVGLKKENAELMERNMELAERLKNLEEKMKKIGELANDDSAKTGKAAGIIFGPSREEISENEEDIRDMSRADFEAQYGSGVKSIGLDPRVILKDAESSSDSIYFNDPLTYLEKINKALDDEDKDVVVVENQAYIVDKK